MAIDTAADRRSAAGLPFLPAGPGVTPDAAKPVAWRQQAGWGYSGVAAGAPPANVYALPDGTWQRLAVPDGSWQRFALPDGTWDDS